MVLQRNEVEPLRFPCGWAERARAASGVDGVLAGAGGGLNQGISRQALAGMLGMLPSRLVTYLDELESRGLRERRDKLEDRRLYALALTEKGGGARHGGRRACCPGARRGHLPPLERGEREQLHGMLRRLADHHGLTPGVHPGFSRLRPAAGDARRSGRPKKRTQKSCRARRRWWRDDGALNGVPSRPGRPSGPSHRDARRWNRFAARANRVEPCGTAIARPWLEVFR